MMAKYIYNLSLKFDDVVKHHGTKTAIKYSGGNEYSFNDLNNLINEQVSFLHQQDYQQGDVIAIFNEKSIKSYALMLACLKMGIIYTNLDGSSPWARIQKIIYTCNPRGIFYDENASYVFSEVPQEFSTIKVHFLKENVSASVDTVHQEERLHGNSPAYIMFTSGSTGFPKGAVMSHQNLLHFIEWGRQTFSVTEKDIFTNANPIYFDNSVFDFYVSIFNGATLVPLTHEIVKQPKNLVEAINASGCTIWFSVPSLLVYLLTTKMLTKNDFKSVTRISFGGEGFPKNKLKQLYQLFGDRVTLFNVYGPTECTCICSSYIITEKDFENMNELAPLGFMSQNFGYEIIPLSDANPDLGELCLTGPCVGLGYYNDPERTANSFVQNPFKKYRDIMYKTGDLVERASNGYFHFKGRVDNQIKHMGYRIELEEIEAAFATLPYIDEAGVIYEKMTPELGQIKAFVCVNDINKDQNMILADIKKIVPSYMMPRTIIILPVLPKNQNGKIDRRQLKAIK